MRYTWLDEYLMEKTAVTKDTGSWNWVRYMIGGKMFLAVCLDGQTQKPYYITLKAEPLEGEMLRKQYKDIVPGFYMNHVHWNSIKPCGEVPDELLRELADKSYNLVLSTFGKKKQKEILGEKYE